MADIEVIHGDMRQVLEKMVREGRQVHAVCCDPPYHLTAGKRGGSGEASLNVNSPAGRARISTGFMGKAWDGGDIAFRAETWRLCFDLLPPGGHLLAFSGTRTFHRMAVAIEDAGFEVRDTIGWLYGSGFPKSLNVSKAIDKAAETAAATEATRQWEGWGTALKPSHELVCVAQKPHDIAAQLDMIGSTIWSLERKIWSLLPANVATELFGLSPSELDAACVSAQWSADERSSTRAALCDLMGTSRFALATLSSLNTVSSWLECLGAHLRHANTSIIETASSTTIDLKIWKSCLSRITPASIILAHKSGAWCGADAEPAERFLNADVLRWLATRELSALESASASDATRSLVEEGQPKPLAELICVARKPLEGTVAENVLEHGTGALNIDGCRVGSPAETARRQGKDIRGGNFGGGAKEKRSTIVTGDGSAGRWPANVAHDGSDEVVRAFPQTTSGTGAVKRATGAGWQANAYGKESRPVGTPNIEYGDSGSAARFFYTAKADADDRLARDIEIVEVSWISEAGPCQAKLLVDTGQSPERAIVASGSATGKEWSTFLCGSGITDLCRRAKKSTIRTGTNWTTASGTWKPLLRSLTSASIVAAPSETANGGSHADSAASNILSATIIVGKTEFLPGASHALSETPLRISVGAKRQGTLHPTVKPVDLMRWLVRLVTPPGGTVLDPFAGSGTTGTACLAEGFDCILVEREAEYVADIRRRIAHVSGEDTPLFAV